MKGAPLPIDVQEFLFKQISFGQIFEGFKNFPKNPNLLCTDGRRGLSYIAHDDKLVIVKLGIQAELEWKLELTLPGLIDYIALNCDCSLLAISVSHPSALIYNVDALHKNNLELLHEVRLSTSFGEVRVSELKWNPAIPELLCSVTSDHSVGCFQISKDKKAGVQVIGLDKIQGCEALCVAWSPKGKQLVIGCKNGSLIQLKPELKAARQILGPSPSEGAVVSILWVSNFQFCACYFNPTNQKVNVTIVDAPKGETTATFTTYEDITFGMGNIENGLRYVFEHIPEWGVIIAASTHSSELAVLGTPDNGVTWCQWQLTEDGSAQLPLMRKAETETYPVGLAIDRSSTQKLQWGPERVLPHPAPVLRILVTSGQLCSYHIINLHPNVPDICSPPLEVVQAPPISAAPLQQQQQQPAAPLSLPKQVQQQEMSFNLPSGATSTPRSKMIESQNKPNNAFSNATFTMGEKPTPVGGLQSMTSMVPGNRQPDFGLKKPQEIKPAQNKLIQPTQQTNFKPPNDAVKIGTPTILPQMSQAKSTINSSIPTPTATLQPIKEQTPAPVLQQQQQQQQRMLYDDNKCLRAFYEEQARFEKDLAIRLEPVIWNVGTDEERKLLAEKTSSLEEFLKELKETTNGLTDDIAYLKTLMFQSFAWLEESKSKNSAKSSPGARVQSNNNQIEDLQSLFYYTQNQLTQATKALDLKWSNYQSREMAKMKIPSIEAIYQTLIRYDQIVAQQRSNIDALAKKWRNIGRHPNCKTTSTDLDRSMAGLNLSQSSITETGEGIIDLRCRLIAANTRNFTREKRDALKKLLQDSPMRIVKVVRPSALQDRVEATLSALASNQTPPSRPKVTTPKALPVKNYETPQKIVETPQLIKPTNKVPSFSAEIKNSPSSPKVSFNLLSNTNPPKQDINSAFKFSTKSAPTLVVPQPVPQLDFSALGFKTQPPGLTISPVSVPKTTTSPLAFTKSSPQQILSSFVAQNVTPQPNNTSPQQQSQQHSTNNASPLQSILKSIPCVNLLGEKKTEIRQQQQPQQQSTATIFGISKPQPTTASQGGTSVFGGSSLFGALSTTSASSVTTSSTSSATTTSFSTPAFNFSGLLSTTSSLSFSDLTTTTTSAVVKTTEESLSFSMSSLASTATTTMPISSSSEPPKPLAVFAKPEPSVSIPSSTTITPTPTFTIPTSTATTTSASASTPSTVVTTSTQSIFGSISSSTPNSSTSIFGGTSSTTTSVFGGNKMGPNSTGSIFGGTFTASATPTFGAKTAFGATPQFGTTSSTSPAITTATPTSPFETSTTTTVVTPTSAFGTPTTTTTTAPTSAFVTPTTTTAAASTSAFGTPTSTTAATTTPAFGNASIFGSAAATPTTTSTPSTSTTSVFGGSTFGSLSLSSGTSAFGAAPASTAPSVFGQSTSVFGQAAAGTSSVAPAFGSPSAFGMSAPPNATSASSVFGGSGSSSVFGSAPSVTSTPSIFGGGSAFGSPATPSNNSVFGAPGGASIFGNSGSGAGAASVFGSPPAPQASVFGGSSAFGGASNPAMGSPSTFGQPAAFGAKPVFGSTSPGGFGSTAFGSPAMFGGSPGFGTTPAFGSTSPIGGAAPMNKVFGETSGSNTFEALAAQPAGLTFGSLSQKSPEQPKPPAFSGGSSFSSWR